MITIALDTATDRCSVAASDGARTAVRHLDGARQHARALLGLLDEVLGEFGATSHDIGRILTADGPGSFTGLRVSATVAKALVWGRPDVAWAVAPSLRVRAAAHAPLGGGTVLALADALRGEVYAGAWRFHGGHVEEVLVPRAMLPEVLPTDADVVVGTIPPALVPAVRSATTREPILGQEALPSAAALLALATYVEGVQPVADPAHWEPVYGRPAEAQAVWERKHGQPLPAPSDRLD